MPMHHAILASITGQADIRADAVRGEKRKTLRIPMSIRANLTAIHPRPQVATVSVRNVSPTGIGLLGELSLEAGSEFVVEFPRPGFLPCWVTYRAVRCTRVPSQDRVHSIGAQYVGMQSTAPTIASAIPMDSLATAAEAVDLDRIREAVLD